MISYIFHILVSLILSSFLKLIYTYFGNCLFFVLAHIHQVQPIPQQLMGLFTTSRTTMEIGGAALRIISFGFVVSSVSVTFSGVLEGLGKGMPSLLISLARYIVVMLPVSFVLSRLLQALGVWYGFAVTEYIVAVLSYYIYKFHMRDIKG